MTCVFLFAARCCPLKRALRGPSACCFSIHPRVWSHAAARMSHGAAGKLGSPAGEGGGEEGALVSRNCSRRDGRPATTQCYQTTECKRSREEPGPTAPGRSRKVSTTVFIQGSDVEERDVAGRAKVLITFKFRVARVYVCALFFRANLVLFWGFICTICRRFSFTSFPAILKTHCGTFLAPKSSINHDANG